MTVLHVPLLPTVVRTTGALLSFASLVVTPETVVRWHRAGFRLYWSGISKVRKQIGRKKLSTEVRELIFRMVAENSTWGAPRIHGELLMLGFDVSERSISR
jgi:putative transposase